MPTVNSEPVSRELTYQLEGWTPRPPTELDHPDLQGIGTAQAGELAAA
jgi:hypothetical protein